MTGLIKEWDKKPINRRYGNQDENATVDKTMHFSHSKLTQASIIKYISAFRDTDL